MPRNSCKHKEKYKTYRDAVKAQPKRRDTSRSKVKIVTSYRCDHCKHWHNGGSGIGADGRRPYKRKKIEVRFEDE